MVRIIKKPLIVKFKTKEGKIVKFKAIRIIQKPRKIKFFPRIRKKTRR